MRTATAILSLLLLGSLSFAQNKSNDVDAPLAFYLRPTMSLPLGADAQLYSPGGGTSFGAAYTVTRQLYLGLEGAYDYFGVKVLPDFGFQRSVSSVYLALLAGLALRPLPSLQLEASVGGGYFGAVYNQDNPLWAASADTAPISSNPVLLATASITYDLIPSFAIGAAVSYRTFLGMTQGLAISLSASLRPQRRASGERIAPNKDLELLDLRLENIFPVFYKYYDDHPLGVVTVRNRGSRPIERITASFYVGEFMENPKESPVIDKLAPGETRQIPLYALFSNKLLDIFETTKASANISLNSQVGGAAYLNQTVDSIRIYDRNAMTWDDDRKASSFVTAKDPVVLRFAKNVSSTIRPYASAALDRNLVAAVGIFQSLALFGVNYEIDPSSSYEQFSANAALIDYLQFPRQTLQYGAGDCDDLSILFTSLLQSLGVETAFITIPGHIYSAVALALPPEEAVRVFNNKADLIIIGDTAWMPVETTLLSGGFLKAWKTGAAEWNENVTPGRAKLIPIRSSWSVYEPVWFSDSASGAGDLPQIGPPSEKQLLPSFEQETRRLVDTEIFSRERALKSELARRDSPTTANRLGVLYARFGRTEQARAVLEAVVAKNEYVPALLNLAMIAFLDGDYDTARSYYERAGKASPDNPSVLLGIARVEYETEDYGRASAAFGKLKGTAPALAEKFAYLDLAVADEGTRAANAADRGQALWEEE